MFSTSHNEHFILTYDTNQRDLDPFMLDDLSLVTGANLHFSFYLMPILKVSLMTLKLDEALWVTTCDVV